MSMSILARDTLALKSTPSCNDSTKQWAVFNVDNTCLHSSAAPISLNMERLLSRGSNFHLLQFIQFDYVTSLGKKKQKNDVLLKLVGEVIGYKSRELVTTLLSMERRNDAVHSSAHTDYGNIQRSSTATIHQATPVQKIVV